MNRFFRTAYATTLVYIIVTLAVVSATGISISALSFAALYIGLFVFLLPNADASLIKRRRLCCVIGAAIALLGFLPIILASDNGLMHCVGYGIGLSAAIVFLVVLRHRTRYSDFEAVFRFSAVIVFGIIIAAIIASTSIKEIIPLTPENMMHAFSDALLLMIVRLVTGFLLLRGLRAEQSVVDLKSFYRRQFRDALIFVIIVAAVLLLDPFRFLRGKIGLIHVKIIKPFFDFVARTVHKLISSITVNNGEEYKAPDPPEEPDAIDVTPPPTPAYDGPEAKPIMIDQAELERRSMQTFRTLTIIFMTILVLAIVILIIVELRKLIKKLRNPNENKGIGYPNEVREPLQDDEKPEKGEKLSRHSPDARERIRRVYADFLRHLRRRHIKYLRTDTCGQIERRASGLIRSQADEIDELTRIYEDARYCSIEEPTMEEAHRSEHLLGEIRRNGR